MKLTVPVTLTLFLLTPVAIADVGANDLRSEAFSIAAPLGTPSESKFTFSEVQVNVLEVTVVPTRTPKSGRCRANIIINDLLAKIMKWEPPGSIVGNEYGGVDGGLITAGIWEPPGAIVFTPNDVFKVQVVAIGGDKAKGDCAADFLVLGAVPPQ